MPERIQLRRTKGWRMPAGTVVVSRPTKWGNPHDWREYRENFPSALWADTTRDRWARERAVEAFREDANALDVSQLRGKNLACWCKPGDPCHADVLLEIANS
jgi:hypothetical protein